MGNFYHPLNKERERKKKYNIFFPMRDIAPCQAMRTQAQPIILSQSEDSCLLSP